MQRQRHVESAEHFEELIKAGCSFADVGLSFEILEGGSASQQINDLLRHYTVTHSKWRAVALYDIVGFSLHSGYQAILQINSLAHYINLAGHHRENAGLPVDLAMSTTGDGFYVWNRNEGLTADLALIYVTAMALAYNSAERKMDRMQSVPRLRSCIHFGDHFEHYMASGTKPDSRGFIVVESVWPNAAFEEGVGINLLTSADPGPPAGGAVFHDSAIWLRAP